MLSNILIKFKSRSEIKQLISSYSFQQVKQLFNSSFKSNLIFYWKIILKNILNLCVAGYEPNINDQPTLQWIWNIRGYYDRGKIVVHGTRFLVNFVRRVGGRGTGRWKRWFVILACCKFHFIREHENLV